MKPRRSTSWEKDHRWYGSSTRGKGQYFHEHVVIPGALRLLKCPKDGNLLDLGCGSGILGRSLPASVRYTGVDLSKGLIEEAMRTDRSPDHRYQVLDATKPLPVPSDFTHCAVILALQNMQHPEEAVNNAASRTGEGGVFVLVLNHPCFRIPRQSSWGVDETNKMQYRKINRYLSPLEIPITMHPGKTNSTVTWSYHLPLSAYTRMLKNNGFLIETLEEWSSDKASHGSAAKMENRARNEIPLFLAIRAVKYARPAKPPAPPPRSAAEIQ
jgi:SAM-dependent methyltransferase